MKDNSPLVSIIMAVKDTEPYLPACLDSIIAQTYDHWELIAVNEAIRNHPVETVGKTLRGYMTSMKRIV